jgi:hypothetical protein
VIYVILYPFEEIEGYHRKTSIYVALPSLNRRTGEDEKEKTSISSLDSHSDGFIVDCKTRSALRCNGTVAADI